MNGIVKPTEEQRKAILLIEILGLIHDVGKLSDQFIKSESEDYKEYKYNYKLLTDPRIAFKDIDNNLSKDKLQFILNWMEDAANDEIGAPFKEIRTISKIEFSEILSSVSMVWDGKQYNLVELLPLTKQRFEKKQPLFISLFGRNMAPAILVGLMHGTAHYEKENPSSGDKNESSSDGGSNKQRYKETYCSSPFGFERLIHVDTEKGLTRALIKIPFDRICEVTSENREKWLDEVRPLMSKGLADTRRPTNEVTLWDWGFIVAAMSKSAAWWIFQDGMPENNKFAWRTLSINLDIHRLYTRSDTISDLLGVKDTISKSFAQVKKHIEETYAISNRFYKDETGEYYLFPPVEVDNEFKNAIRQLFPPDLMPKIHTGDIVAASELDPSNGISREAVTRLLSRPRRRAQESLKYPVNSNENLYVPKNEWKEARPSNAEICTVCGYYPVGYPTKGSVDENRLHLEDWATEEKAISRNICRICLERRGRRSQDWVKGVHDGSSSTIWTSEVADDNNRLALLIGSLDLEGWLNGTLLSSIYITNNTNTKEFKHSSPVRLYRITETARAFWIEVTENVIPDIVNQRPFRLAINLFEDELQKIKPKLGAYHVYEIQKDRLSLEVVWDKDTERFITSENLFLCTTQLKIELGDILKELKDKRVNILERGAQGKAKQKLGEIKIKEIQRLSGYQPTISLLSEPSAYMTLVPADTAFELVRKIKNKYEREIIRVRDRLPMHLGLVYFPNKTPIRAVLEAGRAMLKLSGNWRWKKWKIVECYKENACHQVIQFENGINWKMPTKMEDGTTDDVWYLNYYTSKPERHSNASVTPIKINQLEPSKNGFNSIFIRPSTFDFEFLDTAGRRFEIRYGDNGKRIARPTRPFYMEDIDRFSNIWDEIKLLKVSQRYQIVQVIESTRDAWFGKDPSCLAWRDETFRQFVHDTLAGAQWGANAWKTKSKEKQDAMIDAGVKGELADLAELHMQIIKDK